MRIDSIAEREPTITLTGVPSRTLQLVDHRQVGRVRDDDDDRLAFAAARHEAVAEHQVGGNRPEQLLVDPELVHVQEIEPVALGQPAGPLRLGRPLRPAAAADSPGSSTSVSASSGSVSGWLRDVHHRVPMTAESWKSGMYSASTIAAMTIPMITSSAGSMSVTKRPTSVSISSS